MLKDLFKKYIYPIAVFSGGMIGVGFLSLPYIAMQTGIWLMFLYFLVITALIVVINLIFCQICLKTPDFKRFPGFVGHYLGKWAEFFTMVLTILGTFGVLLIYLLIGSQFLTSVFQPLFSGSELTYVLIYFFVVSIIIYFDIKVIARVEFWVITLLFLSLLLAFIEGFSHIKLSNIFIQNHIGFNNFFLPYGPLLFALWGIGLIPEVEEMLGGRDANQNYFSGSELRQDSRREERADASAHHERRSNEEYCLNSPARREIKKWLIPVLPLLDALNLNASSRRRALKSSHFLTSKTNSGLHPVPLGKKKQLKNIITISTIIISFFYLLFVFLILGITGKQTDQSALTGLKNFLGDGVVTISLLLGALATFTAFITQGIIFKKTLMFDLKIKHWQAFVMTCFPPLILFLIGLKSFIPLISFIGGIVLGIDGILILLMYKKIGGKNIIIFPLSMVFLLGVIYEIIYFIK